MNSEFDFAMSGEQGTCYYPASVKTGRGCVVICPGGAYENLAAHEGKDYAEFFNRAGLDAYVCAYRVAPYHFPLPLLDVRRAIRYVRSHADQQGIDPERIAVMGSSAGGHLAALASTYFEPLEEETLPEDSVDARPNATILCYPVIHYPDGSGITHTRSYRNFLGEHFQDLAMQVSPDLLVSQSTPPAFIWHTADDNGVDVRNSYLYASALTANGIAHELHVFPCGGHGLGLAASVPHTAQWSVLLLNWLQMMGYITNADRLDLKSQTPLGSFGNTEKQLK